MMKAIRHIGVVVIDLDRALCFYKDLLGLKVVKDTNEPSDFIDSILSLKNTSLRTVKMKADDGNLIELLCFKSHLGKPKDRNITEIGCSHVAFTVDNIDELYNKLTKKGVVFNSSPRISPDSYAKVAFCKDPDGTFIELVEVLKEEK